MNTRRIHVQAPSNIALIKYMGKLDFDSNIPSNASLSMTLDRLCTETWMEVRESDSFEIQFAVGEDSRNQRAEKFMQRLPSLLKEKFRSEELEFSDSVKMSARSENRFPTGAGIASSASGFAAMTLAGALALSKDPDRLRKKLESDSAVLRKLASISRMGSGSSCRSFEGPFVQWEGADVCSVESNLPEMVDLVVLVDQSEKKVGSSQAHRLAMTSPHWGRRPEIANERVGVLKRALVRGDLRAVSQLAWLDSFDMHHLFHSAKQPFSYWKPQSLEVLNFCMEKLDDPAPPVVTMDAGANVHVLVPASEADRWERELSVRFADLTILRDQQGKGARVVECD